MTRGTVILTPFPFTDLTGQKNRPAVVVSRSHRLGEDVIAAFISSVIRDRTETDLLVLKDHPDFGMTGLKSDSVIKLDKLATISRRGDLGTPGKSVP